jgi:hypothetical protein
MKRVALIFTSGTAALGVTALGFQIAAIILNTAMRFQPHVYNITWLK